MGRLYPIPDPLPQPTNRHGQFTPFSVQGVDFKGALNIRFKLITWQLNCERRTAGVDQKS